MADSDHFALRERISCFLHDESSDTVLGPRRMPRSELVELVEDVIVDEGLSDRFIVLDHWSGLTPETVSDGRQVLFGQDLCHQVPAVVRHRGDGPVRDGICPVIH